MRERKKFEEVMGCGWVADLEYIKIQLLQESPKLQKSSTVSKVFVIVPNYIGESSTVFEVLIVLITEISGRIMDF